METKEEIYKKILNILEKKYSTQNYSNDIMFINKNVLSGGANDSTHTKLLKFEAMTRDSLNIKDVAHMSFNRILKHMK